MFENLTTEGHEESQDRLGGYALLESGLYDGVVKMAYISDSASGDSQAKALNTIVDYGDHEMTETVWFLNRKGENFYERNGKKFTQPGFDLVNSLALMTTGQPFAEQTFEEKTIDIYDYDAKKELPKSVTVVTSLLTQKVTAGVLKLRENKQKKNESTGEYEDINEARESNKTDKYFHFDTKRTVAEVMKGGDIAEEDLFYTKWGDKNRGVTRDTYKEVSGPAGNAGGAPSAGTGAPKKSKNLFGN